METVTIEQSIVFKSTAHLVYESLMDSERHSAFTGARAEISREIGEAFSAYEGYLNGKQLELVPDQRIKQSWHAASWSKDHSSIVIITLKDVAEGVELCLTHEGVPAEDEKGISEGWYLNYWNKLAVALDK
ncbi:SRPBCC domain-containing protein [bacterium]|nr:SRPBCC domain-containing protein [bacterium]